MTPGQDGTAVEPTAAEVFPPPGLGRLRQVGTPLSRSALVGLALVNAVVIARVAAGLTPPWWVSVLALAGVFVPTLRLVSWKTGWQTTSRAEQLIYAFAAVVLALLVMGLLLNSLLPLARVTRPLDPLPVLVAFDAAVIGLLLWRRTRRPPPPRVLTTWVPYSPLELWILGAAAMSVLLVAVGAVRLNNGASGSVTLAGVLLVAVTWALLLVNRDRLRPGPVHLSVYLVGLALLLMTAMRGWMTTGHDVQREYRLFRVVLDQGHWDIATYRDAYNACLSVTILPAMIHDLTGLDPVWVMKLVPSLAFAACPVAVYLISQRFVTRGPALLGSMVFMAFPTYFTDMPFLTRQEFAFTFLAAGFLAATNLRLGVVERRLLFGAFSIGVLFSHYSTNYVLIVILGIGLFTHLVLRGIGGRLPSRLSWLNAARPHRDARLRGVKFVLGLSNLVVLVLVTLVWAQGLTGTGGHLAETLTSSVQSLLHRGDGARSSDTGYTILGGASVTPDQRIAAYRTARIDQLATERAAGVFLPLDRVEGAATPAVPAETLPRTLLGDLLAAVGIDGGALNALVRALAARLLQVFVVVGVVAVLFGYRRRWINVNPELTVLAGASFVVVLTQVLLPGLSVEYGVLRAFQQGLLLLAPFLAIGMIASLSWLRSRAAPAAGAVGLVMLLSLTGVLPQLTGGYPAQLHLNNSGQYYDLYYTRPTEVAAADWMLARVRAEGLSEENNTQTDRFSFGRVQSFRQMDTGSDIFPVDLRTNAYTLLTTATVTRDQASLAVDGDVVTYRYPLPLLESLKNLVYSNGSAVVLR